METNKYQENIGNLKNWCDDLCNNEEIIKGYYNPFEDLDSLQELVNTCLKSNSIEEKLNYIKDIIDCYAFVDNEKNDEINKASDFLNDIKQAYSFRLSDAALLNELRELTGTTGDLDLKAKIKDLLAEQEEKRNYESF